MAQKYLLWLASPQWGDIFGSHDKCHEAEDI